MAKASRKKKKVRERKERRFVAQSSQNKMLVAVIGAVGSAALGAGIYGQIWGHFERAEGQWLNPIVAVAAGGALLLAVAIWLGFFPVNLVGTALLLMVPTFALFKTLGWVGTFRPLWVPAFFGSAFSIFSRPTGPCFRATSAMLASSSTKSRAVVRRSVNANFAPSGMP